MEELKLIAYSIIMQYITQDDLNRNLKPDIDIIEGENQFSIVLTNCKLKKSIDKIKDEIIEQWQFQHINDVEILSKETEKGV